MRWTADGTWLAQEEGARARQREWSGGKAVERSSREEAKKGGSRTQRRRAAQKRLVGWRIGVVERRRW